LAFQNLFPQIIVKRKTFLKTTVAAVGSSFLPAWCLAGDQKKRGFRFAHITDIHVKPGIVPETGMAKALQHVQKLHPQVEFVINGGDSIWDAMEADKEHTQLQWDLFHSILQKENSLPIYHCIGNHDIWGWFIKENRPESDKLYAKAWVLESLRMKNRYYRFTKLNWHFIVLDSVQLNPAGGYIAYLDPEQLEWLKQELATIPKDEFICIVSHVPILSICAALFFEKTESNGDLKIQRNLMHTDFMPLKKIFVQFPNIKVCLSGHIHLQDELHYLGVKYYCNGAVSGNWWKGSFQEFAPAYAVLEVKEDGSFSRTMVNYE
jgi:3',5'-cyclic AMP phosphodiesterase CpdA